MNSSDFKNSVIGKDYLLFEKEKREQPSIDSFLDYVNHIKKMKLEENNKFPDYWYQREIEASYEIIKTLSNDNT